MPTYSIIFEGSGIEIEAPEGLARGFFVTVVLDAADEETAEARARLDVYRAWTDRGYRKPAGGIMPDLTVSEMRRIGALRALVSRKDVGGFILFPD